MDMNRGVGNEHDQHDNWDEQRERLSAYIDGELPPAETRRLEAHLATCAECRRELDQLRRLRTLLRALPTPRPPRSFALPETGPVPVPAAVARRERQTRRRVPVLARAAQWAGGLVAAAGLLLVLGSALPGFGAHPFAASSTGAGSSAANAPASSGSHTPYISPTSTDQRSTAAGQNLDKTHAPATAGEQAQAAATPTPSPAPTTPPQSATPGVVAAPSGGNIPVLPLTGAGLAVGGGALLVGGRIAERRRSARSRR